MQLLLPIRSVRLLAFLSLCAVTAPLCRAQVRVLVDQVGYETTSSKVALIEATEETSLSGFTLVDQDSGRVVFTGTLQQAGSVDHWRDWQFWKADFSTWRTPGHYMLRVAIPGGIAGSCACEIGNDLLERETLSSIIYYFKGQRASGDMDVADRHLLLPEKPGGWIDVDGGWYDATGDYGIHLSHQNPTAYFNPQQVPLVAWTLLASYDRLMDRHDDNFSEYERRLLDEGLYGADFLVRMRRPDGSFLESINAPGPEKLSKDRAIGNPNWRTRIKTSANQSTETIGPA